jgi:hypothetical protein
MPRRFAAIVVLYLVFASGATYAQECLHGATENSDQAARRRAGTDVLPDWQLTLDVTNRGYWFMIKDKTDPCGFGYVSNQAGVIFRAEPIR